MANAAQLAGIDVRAPQYSPSVPRVTTKGGHQQRLVSFPQLHGFFLSLNKQGVALYRRYAATAAIFLCASVPRHAPVWYLLFLSERSSPFWGLQAGRTVFLFAGSEYLVCLLVASPIEQRSC